MRRTTVYALAATVLTVTFASAAAGINHYNATQEPSPTALPTPTPTPEPTALPTPNSTISPAPTPTMPTPTGSSDSTLTPTPNHPELTTQEKVRDSTMAFIQLNHPETATFMTDLNWTGGRTTPANLLGAETYKYYSQGWNVTIIYPVVPNPNYKITADYTATSTAIPYRIIWKGTQQNENINETSYTFAQ